MTHEFKKIVEEAIIANHNGFNTVMASVVALDGSSYRKPGVRMLIIENGQMIGAVSGGCIEKEICLQAESVLKTGVSKIMTYDGRYRLGCEGVLYILIEPFKPYKAFETAFIKCLIERNSFEIISYFDKKTGTFLGMGTWVNFKGEQFSISGAENNNDTINKESLSVFKHTMEPCFKLVIIGAEHDAVQLCKLASQTGWEVTIISGPSESKIIQNFPGAKEIKYITAEELGIEKIDDQTAVVLMTHNFANDLRHLVALEKANPIYIGILGPVSRRDDLLSQFMEYCPDVTDEFLELIHGPAGLNIGSETPQEIAISIISEILAVVRNQEPMSLSKKTGSIHASRK